MNLYFTLESRDYLDVFSVSVGLRTGSSLMCKESVQLQIEKSKMRRIRSFHVVVSQRTARKCTKISNARAELLFFSLSVLFGDDLVAVAVVVCLSSLLYNNYIKHEGRQCFNTFPNRE